MRNGVQVWQRLRSELRVARRQLMSSCDRNRLLFRVDDGMAVRSVPLSRLPKLGFSPGYTIIAVIVGPRAAPAFYPRHRPTGRKPVPDAPSAPRSCTAAGCKARPERLAPSASEPVPRALRPQRDAVG